MARQRGYPDRRGMGAQSDFISESFVPSERYRAEQRRRAEVLLAAGLIVEQVAGMLSLPIELLSERKL